MPTSKAVGSLWFVLIALAAVDAVLGLIGSDEGTLSVLELIVEIASVAVMPSQGGHTSSNLASASNYL